MSSVTDTAPSCLHRRSCEHTRIFSAEIFRADYKMLDLTEQASGDELYSASNVPWTLRLLRKKISQSFGHTSPFVSREGTNIRWNSFKQSIPRGRTKSLFCNKWQTVCILTELTISELGLHPGKPDLNKLITIFKKNNTWWTGCFIWLNIKFIPSCPFNAATEISSQLVRAKLSLVSDGRPTTAILAPSCDSLPFIRHWATALLDVGGGVRPSHGALWECRSRAISLGCQWGLSLRLNNLLDWGLHSKELLGALQEPPQWSPLKMSLSTVPSQNIHAHTGNCPWNALWDAA